MTFEVTQVPVNQCQHYWPQVKKHLIRAIETSGGRWEREYVLASLVTGRQVLWVIHQGNQVVGALTTEIINYPERKMVMVHFLGGDGIGMWYQQMSDTIANHGKENGCTGIECIARSGFWKWFQPDGFKRTAVFYEKSI